MDFKNLLFEVDDGVATITFNRPKVLNAISSETLKELANAVNHCKENNSVGAIVLTGAGDKAFVVGADITEITKMRSVRDVMFFNELAHDVLRSIELMEKPVIAAINGLAMGGGDRNCGSMRYEVCV